MELSTRIAQCNCGTMVTGSTVNIELMEAHSLFRFHFKSHNCAINICTMECDESIIFINCDIY